MSTNWRTWHAHYEEPESSLARRLAIVRHRVAETLAEQPREAPIRILSLCSGDGRDLLPQLASCRRHAAHTVLVEQDQTLAHDARTTADRLGLAQVKVITGDAGDTAAF
jgi:putative methyltransferase